jgi:hypothetical protein
MEKQHQPRLDLVKLPLLPAEVKTHLQPLLQGHVERRRGRGCPIAPESRDSYRCGMPTEAGGAPDRGFLQGVFEELADRHRSGVVASWVSP